MDNSADLSPTGAFTAAWAPSRVAGAALGVGGVVLLIAAVAASSDPAGLVLMGLAGLLLVGFAAHALLVRPRLAVRGGPSPELTVRTMTGTHSYRPDQMERIRVVSMRRVGRRTGQLELDARPDAPTSATSETATSETAHDTSGSRLDDTRLMVFSRWDLGTDLDTVADELRRAGFDVDR